MRLLEGGVRHGDFTTVSPRAYDIHVGEFDSTVTGDVVSGRTFRVFSQLHRRGFREVPGAHPELV